MIDDIQAGITNVWAGWVLGTGIFCLTESHKTGDQFYNLIYAWRQVLYGSMVFATLRIAVGIYGIWG